MYTATSPTTIILCILASVVITSASVSALPTIAQTDYEEKRNALIHEEKERVVGSHVILTDREKRAQEIISRYKEEEWTEKERFYPMHMFQTVKDKIESTDVFKIIKKVRMLAGVLMPFPLICVDVSLHVLYLYLLMFWFLFACRKASQRWCSSSPQPKCGSAWMAHSKCHILQNLLHMLPFKGCHSSQA